MSWRISRRTSRPGNGWAGPASGVAFLQANPGKGEPLKAAKKGVLQSYVTYDTLRPGRTPVIGIFELAPETIAMSKQAEFAVILKMNPMFADLDADELQRIPALSHTQHLTPGEMLCRKGDPGDALFAVRRGQIRIETGTSDGSRLTLNFLGPGDLFGEVAVLDGQSRTADPSAGPRADHKFSRARRSLWRSRGARRPEPHRRCRRGRADRVVRFAARGFS